MPAWVVGEGVCGQVEGFEVRSPHDHEVSGASREGDGVADGGDQGEDLGYELRWGFVECGGGG